MVTLQACGGDDGPTPTAVGAGQDGTVSVAHRNYAFEPERLAFEVGETVEFRLSSDDSIHTFTVRDLGINWTVSREPEPQVQTFTFDRAGTFRLVCAIPGHERLGMSGTIEVR